MRPRRFSFIGKKNALSLLGVVRFHTSNEEVQRDGDERGDG